MTHVTGTTVVGDQDVYFFREGTHTRLYDILGCRLDPAGASFGVWAPNARAVSVIGEFNGWDGAATPLHPRGDASGLWEGAAAGVARGMAYKYRIVTAAGAVLEKADPLALFAEVATRRCRSTRCTSAPGGAPTGASRRTAKRPSTSRAMRRTWDSRTWN